MSSKNRKDNPLPFISELEGHNTSMKKEIGCCVPNYNACDLLPLFFIRWYGCKDWGEWGAGGGLGWDFERTATPAN